MFKLIRFIKGHTASAIIAPICKLIEAIMELAVPMIIANVIDVGIASGDKQYVITYCSVIAVLAVVGFAISVTGQFLASKVALGFGTKLRAATFRHINALPVSVSDRFGSASIVTRLTGDVMNCQSALNMFLRLVLRIPFVLVGAFIMSVIIDPILSMTFLAMTLVLAAVISCVLKLTLPRVKKAQKNLDELSRQAMQSLSGARVIRAFSKQDDTVGEFKNAADVTAKTNIVAARISALLNPLTFAVVNLSIIAVLWFGGVKIDGGSLSQGQLVALINYLTQAFFIIITVGNVFTIFTRSAACASRVNEILDTPIPEDGEEAVDFDTEKGGEVLRFDNVSFAYDGDYDVRNISFSLDYGKTLGIIGGTGSGKSTLVALAERFYDPAEGEVYFCGKKANDYKIAELRKNIGFVPQRAATLCGTLDGNLRIADESVTAEREVWALETAQAGELLKSKGLDGEIAADGKNLSGGQRQRVSIARALCRDNILYLFDDCTSALDYKTEREFINAMRAVSGAKLYVSQRISAVSGCDSILVLDGGKIVGYGTHAELKKECPLYAEFCTSQQAE